MATVGPKWRQMASEPGDNPTMWLPRSHACSVAELTGNADRSMPLVYLIAWC